MSRVPLTETVLLATVPASFDRNREVLVHLRGTETKATVYGSEVGGGTLSQPLLTDAGGRPRGSGGETPWLEEGSYDLSIDGQVVPWEAAKGGGIPDLSAYQKTAEKGVANGYPSLEAAGKIPVAQLSSAIMEYQGAWNASTNSPALADGSGNKGDVYRVTAAAERDLGSGKISFEVGDYAIYNGSIWEKSDTTDAVASVAGKKGAVTLVVADVTGAESTANKDTDTTLAANSDTSYPSQKAVKTYVEAHAGSSLEPFSNVKASTYGAKGDGSTDDAAAIQKALTAAKEAGGGIVYLPPGTYIVKSTLKIDNNVTLMGAGSTASIVKLGNKANKNILECERNGKGGATGGASGFRICHLGFDGNKAENTSGGFELDGLTYSLHDLYIHDLAGQFHSEMSRENPGENMEAVLSGIRYMDCGGAFRFAGPHDSVASNVIVRRAGEGACLEAPAPSSWADCHTYGNTDYGIVADSTTNWSNCQAEGTKKAKLRIIGAEVVWIGGRIFSAGGEDKKLGIEFAESGTANIIGVKIENCDAGSLIFTSPGYRSIISGEAWGSEAKPAVTGAPDASVDLFDLTVAAPLTYPETGFGSTRQFGGFLFEDAGDMRIASRIAFMERGSAPGQAEDQAKVYAIDDGAGKTGLRARMPTGTDVVLAKQATGAQEIASGSTITPLDAGPVTVIKLTGTAEVKKITATRPNHMLAIIFTATAKLVDGENLKLIESKAGTADDVVTLVCDGTNWYQCASLAAN